MKRSTGNKRNAEGLEKNEIMTRSKTRKSTASGRSEAACPDEKNIPKTSESSEAGTGNILSNLEREIGPDGYYYECMMCEDGGKLLCCQNCPGTYHRKCLGLRKTPKGKWLCPTCRENADSSKDNLLKDLRTKKRISLKKVKAASKASSSKSK